MTKSPYKLNKGEIILELTNLNVSFDQKASMRELRNLLVKAQKNNEKTKTNRETFIARLCRRRFRTNAQIRLEVNLKSLLSEEINNKNNYIHENIKIKKELTLI